MRPSPSSAGEESDAIPTAVREALAPQLPEIDLEEVRIAEGIPWLVRRLAVFEPAAVTVGRRIFFAHGHRDLRSPEELPRLVHELVHVQQWQRRGRIGFLVGYFGGYLRNRLRGLTPRVAYERIPLEVEARRRELEIRADLERRFREDPGPELGVVT